MLPQVYLHGLVTAGRGLLGQNNKIPACSASNFADLTVFGAAITSVTATSFTNHSLASWVPINVYPQELPKLSFCEVTIQYTHPGQDDSINVWVWLPNPEDWSGRFMGVGGGGWSTGFGNTSLAWPVSQGFSAVSTDGGHGIQSQPTEWGLSSPGNVNWVLLQDFASRSLDDAATIGKAVTTTYYGSAPRFSYWNGCSTGGRQGHMMAQRYPKQYNGILATAPAHNWASLLPGGYWPQLIMNLRGKYPSQCELDAITQAAIEACDRLDGVTDGIILNPVLCAFNPFSVVGQSIHCDGTTIQISSHAASIAAATWQGPETVDGKFLWYGLNSGASFAGQANTDCTGTGNCSGLPFSISTDWISVYLKKDLDFDPAGMSQQEYDTLFRQSVNEYNSIIGTEDVDLTDFRNAGGKLINWHGLTDQIIPPNGSVNYYERLLAFDPHANDYYRFFEAPGIDHCLGGVGWLPGSALDSVIKWVEEGIAPETLSAQTIPGFTNATVRKVDLCLYPKKLTYIGGDINVSSSFTCQ